MRVTSQLVSIKGRTSIKTGNPHFFKWVSDQVETSTNKTTIDLPTTDDELKRLMIVLIEAFGSDAISHLKSRKWI
jgi:hypothetical protein